MPILAIGLFCAVLAPFAGLIFGTTDHTDRANATPVVEVQPYDINLPGSADEK